MIIEQQPHDSNSASTSRGKGASKFGLGETYHRQLAGLRQRETLYAKKTNEQRPDLESAVASR
jgi:hypothetical protein